MAQSPLSWVWALLYSPPLMISPLLRFAALFFLFLLGFSVLSVATALQNHLQVAEQGIAAASTWLANLSGSSATVDGNYISAAGLTININHECTGVFVLFVLISFIGAYPAPLTTKLLGILIGLVGLTLVNVIRIATLVRIIESYPQAFAYFHEYIWQGAFLMLVTLYSITWVEWSRT
jgi:exosortase/archaeosortase family protein